MIDFYRSLFVLGRDYDLRFKQVFSHLGMDFERGKVNAGVSTKGL